MRVQKFIHQSAIRLWVLLAILLVVVGIRHLAAGTDHASPPSMAEIQMLLDAWRIDVVSNDGSLEVSAVGDGVRAERTAGLKRQWRDGFAVRGTCPEAAAEIRASAEGEVHVFLRGEYWFKAGRSLPQRTDFLSVETDEGKLLCERVSVDYRNARKISLQVKAGEVIRLRARTAPHEYTAAEVRELLAAWFDGADVAVLDADEVLLCRRLGACGTVLHWLSNHQLHAAMVLVLMLLLSAIWLFASSDRVTKWKWTFLGIMLALLVMPLLFCSNAALSVAEKRRLAEFPSLCHNGALNKDFPKGLERWFNDHFGGRSAALDGYASINQHMNSIVAMGPGRWNKRTGWVFKATGVSRPEVDARGVAELARFRDWLGEQGVALYLVVVPDKERVCAQEADSVGVALDRDGLAAWREALSDVLGNRLILPVDELMDEQAKACVYFKTSHHWTQHGAFLGWRLLGAAMLANGDATDPSVFEPEAYVRTKSRFVREDFSMVDALGVTASLYFGLGIADAPSNMLDVDYLYYAPKDSSFTKARYLHDNYHCGFDFAGSLGNDKRVCILGNSQSDQWDPFIGNSFRHARRIRFNATGLFRGDPKEQAKLAKNFARDLRDFRADVVVLCLVEYDLARLRDVMRED